MATTVRRVSVKPPRWRAFCDTHQDGYQGGRPTAIKWADNHVKEEHPGEEVEHK